SVSRVQIPISPPHSKKPLIFSAAFFVFRVLELWFCYIVFAPFLVRELAKLWAINQVLAVSSIRMSVSPLA
ncbi:hypothetical protein, partial [Vibrio nigripulchritudo]|uniref:hypothetical protein n=1 Tax=Vibrio nigripulchritudo TaxID=28173 RepID=UPI001E2B5BD9